MDVNKWFTALDPEQQKLLVADKCQLATQAYRAGVQAGLAQSEAESLADESLVDDRAHGRMT